MTERIPPPTRRPVPVETPEFTEQTPGKTFAQDLARRVLFNAYPPNRARQDLKEVTRGMAKQDKAEIERTFRYAIYTMEFPIDAVKSVCEVVLDYYKVHHDVMMFEVPTFLRSMAASSSVAEKCNRAYCLLYHAMALVSMRDAEFRFACPEYANCFGLSSQTVDDFRRKMVQHGLLKVVGQCRNGKAKDGHPARRGAFLYALTNDPLCSSVKKALDYDPRIRWMWYKPNESDREFIVSEIAPKPV